MKEEAKDGYGRMEFVERIMSLNSLFFWRSFIERELE